MAACTSGKTSYDRKDQAEAALLDLRQRFVYRAGSGPVNVYQCDDCGCWHLTSKGQEHPQLKSYDGRGHTAEYWEQKWRRK